MTTGGEKDTVAFKCLIGVGEEGKACCCPSLSRGHVTVIDLGLEPMQRLEVAVQSKDSQNECSAHCEAIILQQGIALDAGVGHCSLCEAVASQQQGIQKGTA